MKVYELTIEYLENNLTKYKRFIFSELLHLQFILNTKLRKEYKITNCTISDTVLNSTI